jgi:hypothetical protein
MINLRKIAHTIADDITHEVESQIGTRNGVVDVFERIAKTLKEEGCNSPTLTVGTMWKCWDLEREERIDKLSKIYVSDIGRLVDEELHGYNA